MPVVSVVSVVSDVSVVSVMFAMSVVSVVAVVSVAAFSGPLMLYSGDVGLQLCRLLMQPRQRH